MLSDSKNLSLDCSVLADVVEVRGAGVGLVVTDAAAVEVDSVPVCEVVGFETEDV